MSEQQKKIVIIMTRGPSNPELVSLPLMLANASLAKGVDVTLILQSHAVLFAHKGYGRHVKAVGLAPLQELMDRYVELGGRFYVCAPCCDSRNISRLDFIEQTELVPADFVIDQITSAKAVLNY